MWGKMELVYARGWKTSKIGDLVEDKERYFQVSLDYWALIAVFFFFFSLLTLPLFKTWKSVTDKRIVIDWELGGFYKQKFQ